jgi:polyphosphate kinase
MVARKKYPLENREISWLHFNARVLQEAADKRNPLMERIRFLGIFSNNQDEFFRVRVATLRRIERLSKKRRTQARETTEAIHRITAITMEQQQTFRSIYDEILRELASHNIHLLDENSLSNSQQEFVKEYFRNNIRPLIFPIMLRRMNERAILRDHSIYLAVEMSNSVGIVPPEQAFVKIPGTISRFIILPSEGKKNHILIIDDAVRLCLGEVFSFLGYDRFSAYTIKFTRDSELDLDNDISKSFLELMEESLKQRKKGSTLRLVYDMAIPEELLATVTRKMHITKADLKMGGGRYHNFKDFMDFPSIGPPEISAAPMPPVRHHRLAYGKSVLQAIREEELLIHFPYQSFIHIIDMLREASIDPTVRSIKMTIYRAAPNSKVINALINAARNGKAVTVYMELQARFDEKANIYWAERLQEEGVKITRTIPGFKVHAKLILIKKVEGRKEILYSNISTGNFNELTSKIYTDTSLLTTDPVIGREVNQVFSLFEANYQPVKFSKLIVSPFNTRSSILRLLNHEIKSVKEGKEGWVILKLNSLVDEAVAQKICEAADAGVKVSLLVRGICVLMPSTEEQKKNIGMISVVDHYLEHSRIFVFCNDGKPLYYLSSADLMTRNLDHRIEVTVPVTNPVLQQELHDYLMIQLRDNVKARHTDPDHLNSYRVNSEEPCRSQVAHYHYFKQKTGSDA